MNLTNFFKEIDAPLKNSRWSWGSVREDGSIVLRVWQDRKIKHKGSLYMQLSHQEKYGGSSDNLGYRERLEHIRLIQSGKKCYMVMCLAKNTKSTPREIKSFNRSDLFLGGDLCELDSDWYLEIVERVPLGLAV
jgi:hypothetical protein